MIKNEGKTMNQKALEKKPEQGASDNSELLNYDRDMTLDFIASLDDVLLAEVFYYAEHLLWGKILDEGGVDPMIDG